MEIYRQKGYEDFYCIAAACPESCCKLWQIMIDDESIEKYVKMAEIDPRINVSLDRENKCFKHVEWEKEKNICAFLDRDELCHLQRNYGEEMLCDTCRNFPRHVEEFVDVREYSLSVSCPHAARMLLTDPEPFSVTETENEEYDDEDDFEDFDYLLYDRLLEARDDLFKTAQDRSVSLFSRLEMILSYGKEMQDALDEGRLFEEESINGNPGENEDPSSDAGTVCMTDDCFIENMDTELEKRNFSLLFDLENLHEDWPDKLDHTWNTFFKAETKTDLKLFADFVKDFQIQGEQLLMFFLYTYFCGAVYDAWIYSKTALAAYSVKWIFYIAFAEALKETEPGILPTHDQFLNSLVRITYQYAREVEHSDINLDTIEEWFMPPEVNRCSAAMRTFP